MIAVSPVPAGPPSLKGLTPILYLQGLCLSKDLHD